MNNYIKFFEKNKTNLETIQINDRRLVRLNNCLAEDYLSIPNTATERYKHIKIKSLAETTDLITLHTIFKGEVKTQKKIDVLLSKQIECLDKYSKLGF